MGGFHRGNTLGEDEQAREGVMRSGLALAIEEMRRR